VGEGFRRKKVSTLGGRFAEASGVVMLGIGSMSGRETRSVMNGGRCGIISGRGDLGILDEGPALEYEGDRSWFPSSSSSVSRTAADA
jgi:hypothetical protein